MWAKELIALCTQKNITICSCESLTAGLFSATLASVPGASRVLKGGIVTYFTEIKEKVVGVDPKVIENFGVVSEECACQMAWKTRQIMEADYCVSFTGNAGPDTLEGKPAGMVCCSIADAKQSQNFTFLFEKESRNQVREHVVETMIEYLIKTITKE